MKKLILSIAVLSMVACTQKEKATENTDTTLTPAEQAEGEKGFIYDYQVKDIDGNDFDFNSLQGKKIMVVNTASECGFTSQYEGLEDLYKKYKDQDFVIVGFPANNFKGQEPGSNEDIKKFCTEKFDVTFPMMAKISVVGEDQAPIYQFLTQKEKNGVMDSEVKWNFQKYLINPNGTLAKVFYSKTEPNDPEIIEWVESSSN